MFKSNPSSTVRFTKCLVGLRWQLGTTFSVAGSGLRARSATARRGQNARARLAARRDAERTMKTAPYCFHHPVSIIGKKSYLGTPPLSLKVGNIARAGSEM